MKVLHILYQSLPNISGSSLRSRDILYSQKEIGINSLAVTSPFQDSISKDSELEIIDGIKYYRNQVVNQVEIVSETGSTPFTKLKKLFRIFSFSASINRIIKTEKPDILHAHATFFCGLAASMAARRNNIPYVYEVRSLWEERAYQRNPSKFNLLNLKLISFLENQAMQLADHVIVINKSLYENIVSRGISKEKLSIVPNAVNTTYIDKAKAKNKKKGLKDDSSNTPITLGYIGSISPIEGLDLLIKTLQEINLNKEIFLLKIYGGGIMLPTLQQYVKKHNIGFVQFMGTLSPSKIPQAYNSIDIVINPRLKSKLTDSVTPLKPLEAMAYKKLVIGSDVNGIKELITDKVNGLLFKADDKESLKSLLLNVAVTFNDDKICAIKDAGFNFVCNEKSWLNNAHIYKEIYSNLQKP